MSEITKEPWHRGKVRASMVFGDENPEAILIKGNGARLDDLTRAIDCVNACAGLPDPKAAVEAAREAIKELIAASAESGEGEKRAAACDKGRKAIQLLKG